MEVAFASAIGVPGVQERSDDAEDIGWGGEKEGGDVAVVEGCDDGGEEVGYGSGCHDAEEHDHLGWCQISI